MTTGWYTRLAAEFEDLQTKINKLDAFVNTEEYERLEPDAQYWLLRQKLVMTEYATILTIRMKHIEGKQKKN